MISIALWWVVGPGKLDEEQLHSNLYYKSRLTKKFFKSLILAIPADILLTYVLLHI
jgi:hypothetical protein